MRRFRRIKANVDARHDPRRQSDNAKAIIDRLIVFTSNAVIIRCSLWGTSICPSQSLHITVGNLGTDKEASR
jgi:uncharacterized lipoprotein YddW (UPF0748 family)